MLNLILRRLLALVPIWIILALVSFSLLHLAQGSPAALLLGPEATPTAIERVNAQLGLNQPLTTQFFQWVNGVFHGNFGESYFLNSRVLPLLLSHFAVTVQLAGLGVLIAVFLGVSAGVVAGFKQGSAVDGLVTFGATVGFAIPEFVLGLVLIIVFAVTLQILPVQGFVSGVTDPGAWFTHLVLPATTIGVIQAGPLARITRAAMLTTLEQDFVRTARARGVPMRRVVIVHALRNAMLPILTGLGLIITVLLSGTFVTEIVFHLPGFGELMLNSALNRDLPTLQGGVLFIGTIILLVNLLIDLSYRVADPRVRVQ